MKTIINEMLKDREKYGNVKLEITVDDLLDVIDITVAKAKEAFTKQLDLERNDKLIPRKVAMKQLNVKTTATMIAWEKRGYLIPRKIGSRVFYKSSQLKKAVEQFHR